MVGYTLDVDKTELDVIFNLKFEFETGNYLNIVIPIPKEKMPSIAHLLIEGKVDVDEITFLGFTQGSLNGSLFVIHENPDIVLPTSDTVLDILWDATCSVRNYITRSIAGDLVDHYAYTHE